MSAETQQERVEVRCPQGPKNLLMKLALEPERQVVPVHDGNMEIFCRDCTRHAKRQMQQAGLSTNFRIIHRFDLAGNFVESIRESV